MNLSDSSFLCIDIGSFGVRAIAHRVRDGNISKSAYRAVESHDTVFAIKSVLDELEKQIGRRFDSAYITGNFGKSEFKMVSETTNFGTEHKISEQDIRNQTTKIISTDGFYPLHIIPLRYDTLSARNLQTPVGYTDSELVSVFGCISYEKKYMNDIIGILGRAHIQIENAYDPAFLLNSVFRSGKDSAIFIDFGEMFTSISIWTPRGPVFFNRHGVGGNFITNEIARNLNIKISDAARIKQSVASVIPTDMDRFTPADALYDFSRSDLNEIVLPIILDILDGHANELSGAIAKYKPGVIFISGGGASIVGISELVENTFKIPVKNIGGDATINALSAYVWNTQSARAGAYISRRKKLDSLFDKLGTLFVRKKKISKKPIPIMPSTLTFDMMARTTYNLFRAAGIDMIHVDIMDGFFVNKIYGGTDELKFIRENTRAHLYVHLMTDSPVFWADGVIAAGADTIIVSAGTPGVRAALKKIRASGVRCGVAINPDTDIDILKPVIRELDDILIMSVKPGNAGQKFDESVLHKISTLYNTRKKYGLKFKISVDGGINEDTAKLCWDMGADYLVTGSYLANANDFPLAVQKLLRR